MRDSSGSFRNIRFIVFPENELDEKRCESREAMLSLLPPWCPDLELLTLEPWRCPPDPLERE